MLTYVATVMSVPTALQKRLDSVIFRFLWSGKGEQIKRDVLRLPRDKGGLGIPNLSVMATALHIRWTQVAVNCDVALTKLFTTYFLSTRLKVFSQSTLSNSIARAGSPLPWRICSV